MAGLLDLITGGASGNATDAQKRALDALQQLQTPTQAQLTLPELEKYAAAVGMTPAQMQSFLQDSNAFNNQNIDQTGTSAQQAALGQLSNVANAGAEGSATQRAQVGQINQDAARNLAGQRGAIDQQAQARGVSPGLLQAALGSQRAGEGLQDAHMAALQSQGQNYQQALQAMAQGGALGGQLQGQQNTQANTVAQAQNAMQQFNAANQQNAAANNAAMQQQANQTNTQNANAVNQANTGLVNQRTQYNAQVPQQVFNNQLQKATGQANQFNQLANTYTGQGQQQAGLLGGLLGAGATAMNPAAGAALTMAKPSGYQNGPPASANTSQYAPLGYAEGGITSDPDEMMKAMALMRSGKYAEKQPVSVPGPNAVPEIYKGKDDRQHAAYSQMANCGGMAMKEGGMIPGKPKVAGDSKLNDTVPIRVSPGEAVIPRSTVSKNPMDIMRLLAGRPQSVPQPGEPMPGHHPEDVAALLAAMKHMRGTR